MTESELSDRLRSLLAYVQHKPDCPRSLPNLVLDLGPGWTQSVSCAKPCNCGLAALVSAASDPAPGAVPAAERTEPDMRMRAEALWEELGGDLCICQRADVWHWCEKCQQRIGLIRDAFKLAGIASPEIHPPDQRRRLLDMLRSVEWVRQSAGNKYACPICHAIADRDGGPGHMDDCELNAALCEVGLFKAEAGSDPAPRLHQDEDK